MSRKKYDMPRVTDEKRAQLIADGVKALGLHDGAVGDLIQIALAVLTTEPVGFTTERAATYEVWNSGSASFWPNDDMGDFALYGAPPIQAITPVNLSSCQTYIMMGVPGTLHRRDDVIAAISAAGGTIEGLDG